MDFPTDYQSDNLPGMSRPTSTPCGTCGYQTGTKVCYEAVIQDKSYFFDIWDANYALCGTLQSLCKVSLAEAWLKVRGWKSMKGEYSDRVCFWFQYGYYMADSNSPSTSEGLFNLLQVPLSDSRYVNKCQRCPGGKWRSNRPMTFKSYVLDKK